jgi:hypothetical protein
VARDVNVAGFQQNVAGYKKNVAGFGKKPPIFDRIVLDIYAVNSANKCKIIHYCCELRLKRTPQELKLYYSTKKFTNFAF